MSLTIGSLFSGIGGLEMGLEQAGLGPVLWQVESSLFARRVLSVFWPHAMRYRDVRTASARRLAPVDVVCGGFPCQDISVAGKGLGLSGERSGLWREFARIVGELRPRFVIVENVAGLVRRGLDQVVADLAATGYAVEATRIRAEDVGAPHRRERLFVVAYPERERIRDEQQRRSARRPGDLRDGGQAEPVDTGAAMALSTGDPRKATQERGGVFLSAGRSRSAPVVDPASARPQGRAERLARQAQPLVGYRWPPAPDDLRAWGTVPPDAQPSLCRLADGLRPVMAYRRALLAAMGNAVVPQVAEIVGRRVLELAREQERSEVACGMA